jgi:hypothetical protein
MLYELLQEEKALGMVPLKVVWLNGKEELTLIYSEVNFRLHLSASVMAHSFSMSTTAVIELPICNLALIKSGSFVRVSTTHGAHFQGISLSIWAELPLVGASPDVPNP